MADHEQLPMFPQDPVELVRLFKAAADMARDQSETARVQSETARVQSQAAQALIEASRELIKGQRQTQSHIQDVIEVANGRASSAPPEATESLSERAGYGPSNPRHRTWRGFCEDLQRQERELPSNCKPTKINFETHGSDTVRAINYAMEGYGLKLRNWPPSRWDASEDRSWRSPKTRQI